MPDVTLVGDAAVGNEASFWFQAVALGDNASILVDANSSIQEGAMLHAAQGFR